jgi:hypothetical protein
MYIDLIYVYIDMCICIYKSIQINHIKLKPAPQSIISYDVNLEIGGYGFKGDKVLGGEG